MADASGTKKRFHEVLAGLFRAHDVCDFARAAGLRIGDGDADELRAHAGLEAWFRLVNHAWRQDGGMEKLADHAVRECGPQARGPIQVALGAEYDEPAFPPLWTLELDRRGHRDHLEELSATVTTLLLVGPRGEGHAHLTAWARYFHGGHHPLPALEVFLHGRVAGVGPRLGRLATRLHDECDLARFGAPPPPDLPYPEHPERWRAWGNAAAAAVVQALLQGSSLRRSGKTVIACRLRLDVVDPTDAEVVAALLEVLWRPVAQCLTAKAQEGAGANAIHCLVSVEAHTDDGVSGEALLALAQRRFEGVSVPPLPRLGPVSVRDVARWLASQGYRPRRVDGREDDADFETHAKRACPEGQSPYEYVLRHFNRDFPPGDTSR